MNIEVSTQKLRLFTINHFSVNTQIRSLKHKHMFAEIHMVLTGRVSLFSQTGQYVLNEGEALIIPAGMYHTVMAETAVLRHIAFQVNLLPEDIVKKYVGKEFMQMLFEKTGQDDYACLPHFIFVCNLLCDTGTSVSVVEDEYKWLIETFFSLHYNEDIHLSDLADLLHLSPMQAERVMRKNTGMTFGEYIVKQRITIAKELMKSTGMSMDEIAQQVGYNTYSGFRKAYKKHEGME